MKDRDEFLLFLNNGDFTNEAISQMEESLSLNDKQLIKYTFQYLNHKIAIIENNEYFETIISNCVDLISILCNRGVFNEDEVLYNRKRIKKARESILAYANKFHNNIFLKAANKLDEIIIAKSISKEDLLVLIKKLVDRKEDVNIIKKLLNTNKGVLPANNNILFDHAFNNALNALVNNSPDIYYYITLLKIFYSSKINIKKYVERLNAVSDEKNSFANEIYNIIHGHKRSLSPDEVLNKYGFIANPKTLYIPTPDKLTNPDFTLTIDGESTLLRDDALSIKKDGTKDAVYIVGIHISDPAAFINPDDEFDIQLRNNYKAIYLPEDVIELFPHSMNTKLSLDKGKYRKVISMYVVISSSGNIEDYTIKEDVIRVNENLSYNNSDNLLETYSGDVSTKLAQLYTVASLLERKNPQKKLYWDKKDNDSIDKEIKIHRSDKIVNELMVLYNYLMAKFMYDHYYPFVYRIQNDSYIENMIKKLNIKLDDSTENIIRSLYLKSEYSTYPRYHNGLKLDMYSQVTSPLRRYPDLYNQFLIHNFYFQDKEMDFDYYNYQLLVEYFNQRNIEIGLMRSEYSRALKLVKD